MTQRNVIQFVCLFLVIGLLQACVNAAVTGAQAVYDRHSLQKNVNDHYIAFRSYQAIYMNSDRYNDTNVSITAFNNIILMTGQTPQPEQREEIENIVRKTSGIKEIYNWVTISKPASALTEISDTWITAKIKTQLIATNEIDPSEIKVVTENGTVYLMGTLLPEEAAIAVNTARTTAGVQSVVKIFSYLRISKT